MRQMRTYTISFKMDVLHNFGIGAASDITSTRYGLITDYNILTQLASYSRDHAYSKE